jgi:hypothetical protein
MKDCFIAWMPDKNTGPYFGLDRTLKELPRADESWHYRARRWIVRLAGRCLKIPVE